MGARVFPHEWHAFKKFVDSLKTVQNNPKQESLVISLAREGIKRYQIANQLLTALYTNQSNYTWMEFRIFVDSYLTDYLRNSFHNIQLTLNLHSEFNLDNWDSSQEPLSHELPNKVFGKLKVKASLLRDHKKINTQQHFKLIQKPNVFERSVGNPSSGSNNKTRKTEVKVKDQINGVKGNKSNKNMKGRPQTPVQKSKVAKRCKGSYNNPQNQNPSLNCGKADLTSGYVESNKA